jgi:thiosulfate dehydrogenase (quinone) large subunit
MGMKPCGRRSAASGLHSLSPVGKWVHGQSWEGRFGPTRKIGGSIMSTTYTDEVGHRVPDRRIAVEADRAADAMDSHREIAYALLRVTFGSVFLFSGIAKIVTGPGAFTAGLEKQFAGKLPTELLVPFGYTLPFAEVAVGALIVLGLFNIVGLMLSGLLLIALTFGTIVEGNFPTVAHNVQYAFINSLLLWFAAYNGYSIDRLRPHGPPREAR